MKINTITRQAALALAVAALTIIASPRAAQAGRKGSMNPSPNIAADDNRSSHVELRGHDANDDRTKATGARRADDAPNHDANDDKSGVKRPGANDGAGHDAGNEKSKAKGKGGR